MCADESFPYACRVLLITGSDLWTEILADILETLLHPCTTQCHEGMPLQETGKTTLGNNSLEDYSFFLPNQNNNSLLAYQISHICLDFVESLPSLPFLTQVLLLCAEFCNVSNGGRFYREYTGKIMILLVGILP